MLKRGRGRPPHPDIRTPREWEVLELIDQGLTNEQIANQLGISQDGAKFHVAQILAKLGVGSRREAAPVAYANRGQRYRRWGFLPFLGKLGAGKTANTIAAGGIATAGIIALVVLFFALRGQSGKPFDMYPGLYVLDLASGKVTRLVDLRGDQTGGIDWTADGRGLLIQRRDTAGSGSPALELHDATTGALLQEGSFDHAGFGAKRLPDGRFGFIYWNEARTGAPGQSGGIAILDPVTMTLGSEQTIPTLQNLDAAWLPDGSGAVVTTGLDRTAPLADQQQLVSLVSGVVPGVFPARNWSPDGRSYIAPDPGTQQLAVFDATSGALLHALDLTGGEAVWSPDSKWLLALVGDDLRVVPSDGSLPSRVLAKASFSFGRFSDQGPGWPAWSPDSQSIVFSADRGGLRQVEVTTGETEDLFEPVLPAALEPKWSPDGTRIAFRISGSGSVYVSKLDGSHTTYVGYGELLGVSPRGDRLAIKNGDVFTVRPDGRRLGPLTDWGPQYIGFIDRMGPCMVGGSPNSRSWSPDGRSLVASRIKDGDSDTLFEVEADRTSAPEVLAEEGLGLTWSPDGSRIAYRRGDGNTMYGSCEVVIADAKGNEITTYPALSSMWLDADHLLVTKFGTSTLLDRDGNVVRSFNGQVVVSLEAGRAVVIGDQVPLALVDLATGAPIKTFADSTRGDAAFSPDGRFLALHDQASGRLDVLDGSSGDRIRTLQFGGSVLFSPDSRTLSYTVFSNTPCCVETLYLLDLDNASSQPREVIAGRGIIERTWAPESSHLAFTYRKEGPDSQTPDGRPVPTPSNDRVLYVLDRGSLRLTRIADNATGVQWFPDGRRIAYQGP
jgi:Tol biopolymer transport system component/DNA-binding CsgD family transcriptional regulator